MIKINVSNTKKLTKALSNYNKAAVDTVQSVTKITAQEVEGEAKRLAPVDNGQLRQSIKAEQQENALNWNITAYMPYSAYQEFGTGGLVKVPNEWTEMAARFKGKGIKQINIPPKPFMYPAYVKGRAMFNKELKEELKALNKRFNNG